MKRLSVSIFLLLVVALASNAFSAFAGETPPQNMVQYNLTVNTIGEGSTTPAGVKVCPEGSEEIIKISAKAGYKVEYIRLDGSAIDLATNQDITTDPSGAVTEFKVTMNTNHTVIVSFVSDVVQYTVTAQAGANGRITAGNGSTTPTTYYPINSTPVYKIVADDGYQISEVSVGGVAVDISNAAATPNITITTDSIDVDYTFDPLTSNQVITASFKEKTPPPPPTYNITVTVVHEGDLLSCETLTPVAGVHTVDSAGSFTLTYSVNDHGTLDSIYVDGVIDPAALITAGSITLGDIAADHTITVYVHCTQGIGNEIAIPSLAINPNPVENTAIIEKGTDVNLTKIELINIMGDIVMSVDNPTNTLNLEKLQSGSYLVRFYTKDGFTTRSIIKR